MHNYAYEIDKLFVNSSIYQTINTLALRGILQSILLSLILAILLFDFYNRYFKRPPTPPPVRRGLR